MTRRSVDLPLPLGPMRATMLPAGDGQVDAVEDRQPTAVAPRERRAGRRRQRSRAAHGRARRAAGGPARPPGTARCTPRTGGRRWRRARGRARCSWSMRVIARMAASTSGDRPDGDRAEDGRAEDRGLEHGRDEDAEAGDVGLDPVPGSLRAGPPQARIASTRTPAASIGVGDVADGQGARLEDGPGQVAAAVGQGQPGEHPGRGRVPDRRALAGEVRQEDQAVGTGRRGRGRVEELLGRRRTTDDVVAEPVERPAGRGHRRPDAVAAGQRGRRHERPGHLDRLVPVHAEAAGRAARVVGVARLQQPGPEIAGEGVVGAARDGDPGPQPERIGGRRGEPPGHGAERRRSGAPVDAQPGRRARPRPGPGRPGPGTSGATASPVRRKASHSQVVGTSAWRPRGRLVALHPQGGGQRPEAPAADAGRGLQLGGLGRGAGVEEGDRRAGRLAALVDRHERRAMAVDADGHDVDAARRRASPVRCSARTRPTTPTTTRRDPAPPSPGRGRPPARSRRGRGPSSVPSRPMRPALTSVVPRSMPRIASVIAVGRLPCRGVADRRRVEGDDGLGGRDVGHERAHDAGPQRPEDRPDLALPGRHADRDRDPRRGARASKATTRLAQLRADERPRRGRTAR